MKGTLQSNKIPAGQAPVIEADFFTFTEADLPSQIASPSAAKSTGAPQFDVMFDCAFLCSFLPSWRRLWATRTAEMINPGGMLITLMGPLTAMHYGGPPYAVSVELYRALLKDAFDNVEVSECDSLPRCEGLEKLGVWRRKDATL
ncbi:hypothetical protein GGF32_005772 [Allomyces javanicus]|nr:hypothetical protein GGF32_005772 [Allomyces javanicus]